MNNFVNRKNELTLLEKAYSSSEATLAVVYGRRRIGKTALLKQFASSRSHCYFMGNRAGEKLQINAMGKALAEKLNEPVLDQIDFNSWDELFTLMSQFLPSSEEERFIFIIDEYQYICQVQPAFSTIIQKWWDEKWSKANMMLILCGSITSMMYKETLKESAPLYGRSAMQLLLTPIPYQYLPEFMPHLTTTESLVEFYSLCGGVPRYIEVIREYANYADALKEQILERNGLMFNEAKYILHEELHSPNTCWSILHAIGNGKSKISELGTALSLPANQLTRYIDLLKDMSLVYRDVPVLEKNPLKSKKGIYCVDDPFIRLWFSSIYPYESFLEFEEKELIINKLQPMIDRHIAYCFEYLCREYVRKRMIDYNCVKIGRQWGRYYEIDIAGVDLNNKLSVVGECKWSNRKIGLSIFEDLQEKISSNALPVSSECKYLFFSKSGFSDDLIKESRQNKNLTLIDSIF